MVVYNVKYKQKVRLPRKFDYRTDTQLDIKRSLYAAKLRRQ